MAEKRSHQEEAGDAPAKRPCVTDAGDSTLPCFIDWCKKNNLTISEKVGFHACVKQKAVKHKMGDNGCIRELLIGVSHVCKQWPELCLVR